MEKECQDDLNKVIPILRDATKALEKITKDDLTQLKSYTNPPESCKCVMEGLCYVLGVDKTIKFQPIEPGSSIKY